MATLANVQTNLGHAGLAREYSRRAVEHADRLPVQYRHFVEGEFYGSEWQTYDVAIEALRQGLELYPDDNTIRSNLAELYAFLERYPESIREIRGDDPPR